MLYIVSLGKLQAAVSVPFICIYSSSGLEDCPKMLECNDLVFDVIIFSGDYIMQLCL